MDNLTTRNGYDAVKARVEQLIAEATEKGILEPGYDNEYIREIAQLSKLMVCYEDENLSISPLRQKAP